jgi:XTP/dITP diphosphohydrolase
VVEGIPRTLPALALADTVLGRAARGGAEPPPGGELGDRLLRLVVEARQSGADAEQELRDAVRRLVQAVRQAEQRPL